MKEKRLSRKQRLYLSALFDGEGDERAAMEQAGVTVETVAGWQRDAVFADAFGLRIEGLYRSSALLLARYASLAAARLVALTESEKEETARRACLDIIGFGKGADRSCETPSGESDACEELNSETAAKLLRVLAEERG